MTRAECVGAALAAGVALSCQAPLPPVHDAFEGRFIEHLKRNPPASEPGALTSGLLALDGRPSKDVLVDGFGGWSLIEEPELTAYLQDVVERVVAPFPHERPRLRVFANSNRNYSAAATPAGNLIVTLGALEAIETEDELAFVLGHEAAHVLLGHFNRDATMKAHETALTLGAGGFVLTVMFTETRFVEGTQGKTLVYTGGESEATKIAAAALAWAALREMSGTLFEPAWSRRQEEEADLLALDLMYLAGYGTALSMRSLERLASIDQEQAMRRAELRRKSLGLYTAALAKGVASADSQELSQTVASVTVAGATDLLAAARNRLSDPHPDAVQRLDRVRTYHRREYRAAPPPKIRVEDRYQVAVRSGPAREAIEDHLKARGAIEALERGDLMSADRLTAEAVAGRGGSSAFPHASRYLVLKHLGETDQAHLALEAAVQKDGASPRLAEDLAGEYLGVRRAQDAVRTLEQASERVGSTEPYLPMLVKSLRASGNGAEAESVLMQCSSTGNADLIQRCQEAAGITPAVAAPPPVPLSLR